MGSGGTGKTSFINLIKNRLQSKTKDISETNLTIIEFNPWIYTTQVDLTKEFFSLFLEKLSNQNKNLEEFKENILLILRFLILTFKRLCNKSIPYSELFVDFLNYCLGIIGTKKGLSLQESKRSISEKLRVRNQRFLVIIDDLDRLTAHDIRMVIQLIKSTADFPNVIYLLGYDENIVSASLNSSSINGREYLQKIINIPITLPKIEASLLHNIAYENFRKKYGKPGEHVEEVFKKGIFPFIKTLRDVNILFNRFDSKFVISENNTHPADLLAITLLEFKSPQVWNWVYNNRYRLCNPIYPDYPPHISDLYKEAKLPYEYCEMLSVLFPHFGNKKIYAPDSEYRISSPLYINNYFLLSLPKEYITDAEIQNFLRHAGPEEMIDLLNSKDAESLNELIRRVAVMYNMTNIPNKRKRYLSDFMIYSDTYFANQLQMPTFSYYTFNLSSTFVESYLNTMERPEWKKYILDTLPKSNIYTLTRASRVLHGCINYCSTDISHISPDTMSEDFKEIFSEIARRIVNSYKKYPDAFEHDEFIFMILTLIASDKHLAKEVFHYYVQTQEKVEKYIEKVSKAGCTMAGFEEVLPLEYLQSGEYHKTICKYTNGCDTSGYPILG